MTTLSIPSCLPCKALIAFANTCITRDLPLYASPTSISPCRTKIVSYNWMHLFKNSLLAINLNSSQASFIAFNSSPYYRSSSTTPGNKSLVIELNKGMSLIVNFGRFTSSRARKHKMSSFSSGNFLFSSPAAVKMAFTALIPKS